MGKVKKIKVSEKQKSMPNMSLAEQIEVDKVAKMKNRNKVRNRADEEEEFVDPKISNKILRQAREQQLEMEREYGQSSLKVLKNPTTKLGEDLSESEEELSDDEVIKTTSYYESIEINEEDEKAIEMFMDKSKPQGRTLADIIMEKLEERKTELNTQFSDANSILLQDLDPKVQAMYEGVRDVLSKYRSGKIPKAFKIVPRLRNWEQILYITEPQKWTAAAMYQATRIFSSNLKENMAQRFYNLVLFPRIRDDLLQYKRLNYHLYEALAKALYKPGAFMKGILLPLLESGTCTLREATIVGSIVTKISIPVLHSSAAILKIAEMDYTGANSILLRVFLDKKYALPYRVIDGVVFHFLRFRNDNREMPVIWHQAFLTFVQRYKSDISTEQREALLELLKYQIHHVITPEVRRELQHAKCRDTEITEPTIEPMVQ